MILETYTGFNPDKIGYYFEVRNWPVRLISQTETTLVPITSGSALECGDGRFDQLTKRKAYGVRVLGGVNAMMAMLTGGDEVGLHRAVDILRRMKLTPGTHSADGVHGNCGYADLWIAGQLESAVYEYKLPGIDKNGKRLSKLMEEHGGKHFRLNGNHQEEAVRLNPFRSLTEDANDGLRFRIDDWFMADLGIPDERRLFKIAESIEKLKPDAAKLEIIVP